MSLSEVEFAFFFPPLLLLYWLLPRRAALQNALLVAASLFFYATWSIKLLPLFVASTLVDFAVLRGFARTPAPADEAPEAERQAALGRRRLLLAAGLVNNLGALLWFKYVGFFANSLNEALALFGLGPSLPVWRFALPLGISFYTMSRVGVLVDTYHGRIAPVRSLLVWVAFVAFFPQLIAGPIGRGAELFDQYEAPRRPDPGGLLRGLGELATGFALKGYVAAQLGASWVDPVFSQPGFYTRQAHWLALAGYTAQVFGDFAGYSLLAIGTARLLGLELPQNFNVPFLSASPPEFWRRWHMSLNRWLFDYIYGPMVTGDGFMRERLGLGMVVVFLISGLWHGATWTFLLWGLLHGLWLLAHLRYDDFYKSLCRKDRVWVRRRKSAPYRLAGWAVTLGFFMVSLIPFRAASLSACGAFARGLASGGDEALGASNSGPAMALLIVALYHLAHLSAFDRLRARLAALPAPVRGVALGLAVVFLLIFSPVGAGTFIYAQF
ncbi:MAG TPA: MBOAT family O-acyltransferase [Polyangiaceae bacterium]|nr:MBOAT family O-acyltransferase [Polyangiaceae bacterium]